MRLVLHPAPKGAGQHVGVGMQNTSQITIVGAILKNLHGAMCYHL